MTIPEKYRYIVVEGPIAVGKTSLARLLAHRLNAQLMLEDAQSNPFLERFYRQPERYAFATQMFFLFQRALQASDLKQRDLFDSPTVSDFLLDKDVLFARMNLADDEFDLYHRMYQFLQPRTATPDLVIYLQAPAETLIERVRRRGWAVERPISERYLQDVADTYASYFHDYDASPLLIVNSEHLNFVDHTHDFDLLLERIGSMRSRREFFNRS
ncbi:MAG: deoxynucleoside kinase [Betaproteobacteria bacterium]|nr:deoxynucleoside kinase [Betaproteobacteria bacterium]MDE2354107.1 deoxynucleoside kinase [Betaproteobacteria bacterium]